MSRLTGADALGLFEAYQAVYAPQELTEEQVWEEVETWVNSLLEEGYDLSDYTWEEMYESYLSEDGKWVNIPGKGRRFVTGTGEVRMGAEHIQNIVIQERAWWDPAGVFTKTPQEKAKETRTPGYNPDKGTTEIGNSINGYTDQVYAPRGGVPGALVKGQPKTWEPVDKHDAGISAGMQRYATLRGNAQLDKDRQANLKAKRDAAARAAAAAAQKAAVDVAKANKVASTPPTKPTTTAATPAPRPTATAAAPKPAAAPAATTPTAPKPATGMLGKTSFERRTPTSAELKAAQAARAGGASPEKALQAAKLAGQTQKSNDILASGKVAALGNKSTVQGTQQQVKADNIVKSGAVAALKPTPTPKPVATPTPKPTATPARNGFGVSAAPIAAKASVATATATPTPAAAKPAAPKPEEGERALTKLPGGNYSSDATSMMSQRTKNILGTTKTPAARPMGSARERMLRQSFDPYDVIKGHLLDEGYADTEEAALAIMINMSEEWRQSIIQ